MNVDRQKISNVCLEDTYEKKTDRDAYFSCSDRGITVCNGKYTRVVTDPENYQCSVYATVFALLPPVIAIGLALITKEVYTSLLAGIITGGLLYSNFNLDRKSTRLNSSHRT